MKGFGEATPPRSRVSYCSGSTCSEKVRRTLVLLVHCRNCRGDVVSVAEQCSCRLQCIVSSTGDTLHGHAVCLTQRSSSASTTNVGLWRSRLGLLEQSTHAADIDVAKRWQWLRRRSSLGWGRPTRGVEEPAYSVLLGFLRTSNCVSWSCASPVPI